MLYSRIVIKDNISKQHFLINAGADVSVMPISSTREMRKGVSTKLFAANGSPIKTCGEKRLNLSLGVRRKFTWTFVVANVNCAIIGSDFLKYYDLLVDVKGSKIIDRTTLLEAKGCPTGILSDKILAFDTQSSYSRLLHEYKDLATISANRRPIDSTATHHISTKGPPTYASARRWEFVDRPKAIGLAHYIL